jgi:multiple sugar transport system ATP-binding protein
MASVSIQKLCKAFGTTDVIKGVDVEIADGEFVILVGPSGCGKSTLLRMVAGLETVSGGTIKIGSRIVNDAPPKARDIAMVFQNYALYPHMTAAENMGFALRLRRLEPADVKARIDRAAGILGLGQLLDRYPRQLSGGQRQRVAIGRAMVREPQVFLFDEPLSNLDAKLRVQMRTEIKKLHQALGATMIYVTHDQVEAMTMADRIVVMNGGVVEQVGRPLDLYDQPATLFVAAFIGSPAMNLLEGTVADGGCFVTATGARLPLSSGRANDGPIGRALVYGIRPEHLRIVESGVPAQVIAVEPTGSETLVVAGVAGGQEVQVLLRDRRRLAVGDPISLAPEEHNVHLFDKSSGRRLS